MEGGVGRGGGWDICGAGGGKARAPWEDVSSYLHRSNEVRNTAEFDQCSVRLIAPLQVLEMKRQDTR